MTLREESKLLFIWFENGERRAGTLDKEVYSTMLFPIFVKHLKPLTDNEIVEMKELLTK